MSRSVHLDLIVLTDDESEGASARIESTARRCLGLWFDPARIYVELAPKED